MNRRLVLLAAGLAGALAMGGGVALASTAGPVSGGAIAGCYTNAEVNGSHALVLQDAGTTCPKGTSAVSWGVQGSAGPQGPAGPAGPQGVAGPAGPPGPAGATGPQGSTGAAGANGNTVLNGTGAPAASVGSDGDFYIDTAADVLYGPKSGGTWPATGTSLVGAPGAPGPAGATGSQGPAGSGGLSCTTDGGAAGTVATTTDNTNNVTLTCAALSTDTNCAHSDGVGQTYTDCNDLLGTYKLTTAQDAATAFDEAEGFSTVVGNTASTNLCGQNSGNWTPVFDGSGTQTGFVLWIYAGQGKGTVLTVSGLPADALQNGCDITATGTWN